MKYNARVDYWCTIVFRVAVLGMLWLLIYNAHSHVHMIG